MMAFPGMLVDAAEEANMKVPPDTDEFEPLEYPHFHCFCLLQLGRAITWGEHWDNAKIIAAVSEDKIKTMSLEDFLTLGLSYTQ